MIFVLTLVTALVFPPLSSAQQLEWYKDLTGENSGHTVCNFLTIPVNAVELSRGSVSLTSSPSAHPGFAASSAFAIYERTGIDHVEWLMGLRNEFIGGIRPVVGFGALSAYSHLFTSGAIRNARTIDETRASAFSSDVALGVNVARQLYFERIAAGGSIYGIQSMLAGTHARTVAGACDVQIRYPWVRARAYCTHISPGISYNDTMEALPTTAGLALGVATPSRKSLTDTVRTVSWDISTGVAKSADQPLTMALSGSCRPLKPLTFMAGYSYLYGTQPGLEGLGIGVEFATQRYRAGAGWKYQSPQFGSVWSVSCGMRFAKRKPTEAMEFLRLAQRAFDNNRYHRTITHARKAIELNPELWQAHSLISRSLAAIKKRKGEVIGLIYAGNNNGTILPVIEGNREIGGIGRQSGAMQQLRNRYAHSIVLNAGHNLGSSTYPGKAKLLKLLYERSGTDAVGYSSDIAHFGTARYFTIVGSRNIPHVGTDIRNNEVTASLLHTEGPCTFLLMGISAAAGTKAQEKMPQIKETLLQYKEKSDVTILISETPWEHIEAYAALTPSIDIILCSAVSQLFYTPIQLHNTTILSCGDSGKYVGDCALQLNENGRMIAHDNRLVPLDQTVAQDTYLTELSQKIATKIALARKGIDTLNLFSHFSEGIFTFQSDRFGPPALFLKIMHSYSEYPLTDTSRYCFNPRIAPDMRHLCYIRAADSTFDHGDAVISDMSASRRRHICPGLDVRDLAYTPQGDWLYLCASDSGTTDTDIFRMRPDAVHGTPLIAWDGSDEAWMSFCKNDERMAFCSNRDNDYWQVYISARDATKPIRISASDANNIKPEFNRSGTRIAYCSDWTNAMGVMDLVVYRFFNRNRRFVTSQAYVHDYCWLGDDHTIIYSAGENTRRLYSLDIRTGESKRLFAAESSESNDSTKAHGAITSYEELHPRMITWKKRRRILYTRKYQDGSSKIYMVNTDGSKDIPIITSQGNSRLPRRFMGEIL